MSSLGGWQRERGPDGAIVLVHPHGGEVATIAVRERVRPLARVSAVIAQRTAALAATADPIERLATVEGEHAAVVVLHTALTEHVLGVIYGDDFQTIVESATPHAEHQASVRDLVRDVVSHFPLGLGRDRYRRFRYRPPRGWQGTLDGLITDWHPPDPRSDAAIKVLPARPLGQHPRVIQLDAWLRDQRLAEFTLAQPLSRKDVSHHGFTGALARAVGAFSGGPQRIFVTAALDDGRYQYVLRLETGPADVDAHEREFFEVVASCVPLPIPASASQQHALHWTT